jgi:hypothetical protein
MKGQGFLLLIVAALACACNRNASKTESTGAKDSTKSAAPKDTLTYAYQTIKERAPDCGNKPDSSCTVADIRYPVFVKQDNLNDTVTGRLLSAYYRGNKPEDNLRLQARRFINSYVNDTSRNTDHSDAIYVLQSSGTVIWQDSSLVTIQIDRYDYDGAAHGSDYTGFINWNTKTNKIITLDDILTSGYIKKITPIAEKIFRVQEKLGDTSSLRDYFFKDAQFSLNNNFLITPVGIQFLYNEYEIKPFSEGQTTLLIPYTQIKHLLWSNTVVSQYIK